MLNIPWKWRNGVLDIFWKFLEFQWGRHSYIFEKKFIKQKTYYFITSYYNFTRFSEEKPSGKNAPSMQKTFLNNTLVHNINVIHFIRFEDNVFVFELV